VQDDAPLLRQLGIRSSHLFLEINGALHRVDRAGKVDQHAIAGDLENSALVAGDKRLEHRFPAGLERSKRADFITLHKPAVANHISGQNSSKATSPHLL
jgi:hypothetical protein